MQEFTQNGITLVFYNKPNDKKFSFLVKDNEELTNKILKNSRKKRILEYEIKFAVKDIFDKIESNSYLEVEEIKNYVDDLEKMCQKTFRASILVRVSDIKGAGAGHNQSVTVEVELPNGKIYTASAMSGKIAKQKAAEIAIKEMQTS